MYSADTLFKSSVFLALKIPSGLKPLFYLYIYYILLNLQQFLMKFEIFLPKAPIVTTLLMPCAVSRNISQYSEFIYRKLQHFIAN